MPTNAKPIYNSPLIKIFAKQKKVEFRFCPKRPILGFSKFFGPVKKSGPKAAA